MIITFANGDVLNNVNRINERYDFSDWSDGKVHLEIFMNAGSISESMELLEGLNGAAFVAENSKGNSVTFSGYSGQSIRNDIDDERQEFVIELIKEVEEN